MAARNATALLQSTQAPLTGSVGAEDEVFAASAYGITIRPVPSDATVDVLPGICHIGMILRPAAHGAIATAILKRYAVLCQPHSP